MWFSWLYEPGKGWKLIGKADTLGGTVTLACRQYPELMARKNWLFCSTRGGPPSFVPRQARRDLPLPDVTPKETM